jgi:hypothetical protein
MTNKHWRELVEIVGVVAIVASLILVASELRQANRIAAAQTQQHISENFNVINSARATDPEFAKLFPKLEAPESHLITATDASQIRGISRHLVSVYSTIHSAYENGLIGRKIRDAYIADLAYTLERWPAIRSDFVDLYQKHAWMRDSAVYKPIEEFIPNETADPVDDAVE